MEPEKIKAYISEHKNELIKKAAILIGATVGVVVIALVAQEYLQPEGEDYVPSLEESAALETFLSQAPVIEE